MWRACQVERMNHSIHLNLNKWRGWIIQSTSIQSSKTLKPANSEWDKKSQSFMRELKFLGSEAFIIFLSCIPLSVLWWVAFTTVTMQAIICSCIILHNFLLKDSDPIPNISEDEFQRQIAEMRVDNISNLRRGQHRKSNHIIHTFFWSYDDSIKFMSYVSKLTCHVFSLFNVVLVKWI